MNIWDMPITSIRVIKRGTVIWWYDVHSVCGWINRSIPQPRPGYRPGLKGD